MFVRSTLFERLGLLDEGFFAYGDDTDFQIRVRKAGYRVMSVNAPVWHFGSASFGSTPIRAAALQTRNNIRLLVKHATLTELLNRGLVHVNRRVLRTAPIGRSSPVERRLLGTSRPLRTLLLLWGILWNLWMLPVTMWRRLVDNRRAVAAFRHFTSDHAAKH
jgi:GT2 family glycosyltransferase